MKTSGIEFVAESVENDSITVYAFEWNKEGTRRDCIGEVVRILTPDRDDKMARAALGRIGDVVAAIQKVRPDFVPNTYPEGPTFPDVRFDIWCTVSGGMTGTRSGVLRGADNLCVYFATREDAEARARELRKANSRPTSTATFTYTVRELRS